MKRLIGAILVLLVLLGGSIALAATPETVRSFRWTSNPTLTDDVEDGYRIGDLWRNEITGRLFSCIDNSVGAAKWYPLFELGAALSATTPAATGDSLVGFVITGVTQGVIFYVDPDNNAAVTKFGQANSSTLGVGRSGTTVILPTIDEFNNGRPITIVSLTSGTSEIVAYAGGLPIGSASGTTPGATFPGAILNAYGESVTLIPRLNSAVSWFVTDQNNGEILTSPVLNSPTLNSPIIDSPTAVYIDSTTLSYTTPTGYVITGAETTMILEYPLSAVTEQGHTDKCPVGPASVGTTIYVPTPTAALHGKVYEIRNTSGVTAGILYASGLPIGTTSGVTRQLGEDVGDVTRIELSYGTGISVYVLSEFKND